MVMTGRGASGAIVIQMHGIRKKAMHKARSGARPPAADNGNAGKLVSKAPPSKAVPKASAKDVSF